MFFSLLGDQFETIAQYKHSRHLDYARHARAALCDNESHQYRFVQIGFNIGYNDKIAGKRDVRNIFAPGVRDVDAVLNVVLNIQMLVGGVVAFVLDNTVPGWWIMKCLINDKYPHDLVCSVGSHTELPPIEAHGFLFEKMHAK
jgi:hypothetical protein